MPIHVPRKKSIGTAGTLDETSNNTTSFEEQRQGDDKLRE